jgi:hypothetical protein
MIARPSERSVSELQRTVEVIVEQTPADDIHTHLYAPAFGDLLLWGIDELLIYHYLVAEAFRHLDLPYADFWALPKARQAELVWETLFLDRSPLSESCRGVLTTLQMLGLDVRKRDLPRLRRWFAQQKVDAHIGRCLDLARVKSVCMTNSPFDDLERPVWERGFVGDPRFPAALRIDPLLLDWPLAGPQLARWGYPVSAAVNRRTADQVRRWLADWARRIRARYLMVSLPPSFVYPSHEAGARLLDLAVLPVCRELGLPFALMPGVKRQVNPELRLAGDGVAATDLATVQNLCAAHPGNRFLITVLARENQHELCVLARKFRNLHVFGCWWFTNIPLLIEEMTRLRMELLGLSFTAQHSDARVLDQIIYKWEHSRRILARVLTAKYSDLLATGWTPTRSEIQRDVEDLLGGSFHRFCAGAASQEPDTGPEGGARLLTRRLRPRTPASRAARGYARPTDRDVSPGPARGYAPPTDRDASPAKAGSTALEQFKKKAAASPGLPPVSRA